jgi:penicillin amidase
MSAIDAALGSVLRFGLTWIGRRRLPPVAGEVALAGLHGKVEVLRDRWGVPHIYADNEHDAFFAQGVVHAQDRLWQLEIHRRTGQGRLSELFGEVALDTDRLVRVLGLPRLAQEDLAIAAPELLSAYEAYAAGINAWLGSKRASLPVEFTLLGHKPEPWTAVDAFAFSRVMIVQLSHAWYGEIVRAKLIEAVGAEHAAELEIEYPLENPTALPHGLEFNRLASDGILRAAQGPFLHRGLGSNNWAVAGSKSDTGRPYLCNDMHLPLSVPCLWYENHLEAPGLRATGVSVPGLPMVLVGHNERIAWGMTLAFTDCEDLFVEAFDPDSPYRYRFEDKWLEAERRSEAITVKGRKQPHLEEVLVTRHGPVISDVLGMKAERLALQSMALKPTRATEGWYRLNHAAGWDDFVEAVHKISAPQLNVAYADTDGNIGYWATGTVPIRRSGRGMIPSPGWVAEHDWIGEVPFEEMPHVLNPKAGFVVTTNNRLVGDDYPHFLGSVWMNGFRARRITDVLGAKGGLGIADFARLQADVTCIPGRMLVERLEGMITDDDDARLALDRLRSWDGELRVDSVGGAVYEVVRYNLVSNVLRPALGDELLLDLLGRSYHPLFQAANEFYGHDTTTVLRMLDRDDSWWLEHAGGRRQVLGRSLKQAVSWLRANLGEDPDGWQWGRIHRAVLAHAMGMQKPLDRVFNLASIPIGGDTDTPCQTAYAPGDPYDDKAWAPSFRQIVDMADLSRSVTIIPPGQSGQLGSPHYDDLAAPWASGEYMPMLWTRAQVEGSLEGRLILTGTA